MKSYDRGAVQRLTLVGNSSGDLGDLVLCQTALTAHRIAGLSNSGDDLGDIKGDLLYPEGNCTFKVEARRANKRYPMNSMEINCALGEAVLDAFPDMKVDVHNPDVRLNVEIREEVYLYSEIIPGPGGMPVGTNGSAMLLLSGGIDM